MAEQKNPILIRYNLILSVENYFTLARLRDKLGKSFGKILNDAIKTYNYIVEIGGIEAIEQLRKENEELKKTISELQYKIEKQATVKIKTELSEIFRKLCENCKKQTENKFLELISKI